VVDDDADVLHLCVQTLTRQGFTVLEAPGSAEAMQICSTHIGMIHLALVDAMLDPAVFQLRSEKRSNIRVPGHILARGLIEKRKALRVIMMSASSKADLKKNGIEVGDIPFLKKPFSREKLLATIRQELERRRFRVAS
jgi:DNA-binding response OmpR family regulator